MAQGPVDLQTIVPQRSTLTRAHFHQVKTAPTPTIPNLTSAPTPNQSRFQHDPPIDPPETPTITRIPPNQTSKSRVKCQQVKATVKTASKGP